MPLTSAKQNAAQPSHSVGVRLQSMGFPQQALVLARLAQSRSSTAHFTRSGVEQLFAESFLPAPKNLSDVMGHLRDKGLITPGKTKMTWLVTPLGRQTAIQLFSDLDLAALLAESANGSSMLGRVAHAVVPPSLAPPTLIPGLHRFLEEHPFERNVFGMTRFPETEDDERDADPVKEALDIAKEVCRLHGLELHLASDRAIHDDLWTNVAAHMWASQYGIAFFENRRNRGLNYNLTIEVGSMLMTGRRCALLKDTSIERMPTDLVGHIYKSVDLGTPESVSNVLHTWAREDLNLGRCVRCKE
jgi:hypothetical protein